MKKRKYSAIIGGVMMLLLSSCSQETPMEKLQKDTPDPSINQLFWTKEVNKQTDLWKEALSYCRANPKKINCMAVRRAWGAYNQSKMIQAGSTEAVVYGSNPDDVLHSPY